MPSYYVHIRAAAEMMEKLKAGVPAGSPLSQAEADALCDAAHQYSNYLAAGAFGPDLFFLLPDFKGDVGKGLLAVVDWVLKTWKVMDDNFISAWDQWMSPVLDEQTTLANALTGGMLAECSEALNSANSALNDLALGLLGQAVDVFGLFSSGTQTGYADSAFYWSDMFHYRKTYQFARALYKNALLADADKPASEPSRVPKQQAFALGWISHCATDVAGHPFTNAKCGGPYRTHWQRHHVIENHMDARVYEIQHPNATNYGSLTTAAMHFALAFGDPDAAANPNDAALYDYFPGPSLSGQQKYPTYPTGMTSGDNSQRKAVFDHDTEPFPDHICELLLKTMAEVYCDQNGNYAGPEILRWDPDSSCNGDGRPSLQAMQNMYQVVFDYVKYVTSSGVSPMPPQAPPLVTDNPLPQPPGVFDDHGGADPSQSAEKTLLEILLALLAFPIWLAELSIWLATVVPSLLTSLATWPTRELLYYTTVLPAWDLYMRCRSLLVLEGFLTPGNDEISLGLVQLGQSEKGPLLQLRADLDDPTGFASDVGFSELSGLDPSGTTDRGYSLDKAYPRAVVRDQQPAWLDTAPADAPIVSSEYVAPWRYPDHNMAGMRVGWEAPRTHAGPYRQGQAAEVLMGGLPGSEVARTAYEAATTPQETEDASKSLLGTPGSHLGDPIDYGTYLIGQLTGRWSGPPDNPVYKSNDADHLVPDFNLDADRGYAYQCWDYLRHAASVPPPNYQGGDQARIALESTDQWQCVPDMPNLLGSQSADTPRQWYGYQEPFTVPEGYSAGDNVHHASAYDPLKRLAHQYLPGDPPMPLGPDGVDLWVSDDEIKDVGMSPTGRLIDA
ncbi:MAG: zinc dependent phospholipase C family protein [Candidatus Limnocylindrales bacterium]|jgi:hypothetical protein